MSSERRQSGLLVRLGRRLMALAVAVLAVLIITVAVVVGVGRALIPHADELRPWLESYLSERFDEPVSIGRVEAHWPRLTPQITLISFKAGMAEDPLISTDRARLEMHLPNVLQEGQPLFSLVVLGLDLVLAEDDDGQWGMRLEAGGQVGRNHGERRGRALTGQLILRDASVRVEPRRLPATRWRLAEAHLERGLDQTLLVARLSPADDFESSLEVRASARHPDGTLTSLRGWLGLSGLQLDSGMVADFTPGQVDLSGRNLEAAAWLDWSAGNAASLEAEFSVRGGGRQPLAAHWLIERTGRRVDAELLQLEFGGQPVIRGLVLGQQGTQWALETDVIDLELLYAVVSPWAGVLPWWPEMMQGRIEPARIAFEAPDTLHALAAGVSGLSFSATGAVPGVSDLDFDVSLAGDRVALSPKGAFVVDWPQMMRRAFEIDEVSGRVLYSPGALELDGIGFSHQVIDARADGWIYLGQGRPFLDFGVEVERVEVGDPRPWLPEGLIPQGAMGWLDQALVHVDRASANLQFHMRAGRRAADLEPGDFHAGIEFAGAELDYWPDWPMAILDSGEVEFSGRGLYGQVPAARMGEVALSVGPLLIPDLTAPELSFLVVADSQRADDMADLLTDMPVPVFEGIMGHSRWSGKLSFATKVVLPFRRMEDWMLEGEAGLEGVDVELPGAGLRLAGLRGTVPFDRYQVLASTLHARARERLISLDVAASLQSPAGLELGGEVHPADLVADEDLAAWLAPRTVGSSYWQLGLKAGQDPGLEVTLQGDLVGLGLELPEPLRKLPEQRWPLSARLEVGDQEQALEIRLDDRLDIGARGADGQWRIATGVFHPRPAIPDRPGFVLEGELAKLDLMPWLASVEALAPGEAAGQPHGRARLQVQRLHYGDLFIEDVALDLERAGNAWELTVDGDGGSGRIALPIPMDSGRVLAVDLGHLHVHDASPELVDGGLDVRPTPRQTSTASPQGRPPLHVLIEDLRFRHLELGRVRMETHAGRDGMEIERFEAEGPSLRMQGAGRWVDRGEGPHSEFEGRLITDSLTELLAALDYETGLEANRTQVDLSGQWPGAPTDFSLQRLQGRLVIDVADGLIPEARPGAGRLLGLVSISAIPRRLMLDFRDVFAQGLKFDQMNGEFELADGMASTDELRIEAPAARIRVSGSTDLVERRYDQYLVVEPGVGGTLPVLGVLAGGPVGAAAGLVLQTLFERPLRGIAEARYAITGSWEAPVVELVEARVSDEEGVEEILVPEPRPD